MSNTSIQLKYSVVSGNTPTSLANGELAINTIDGKIFYRNPSGVIKSIQNYPGPSGLDKEIQFNDLGVLGSNSGLTFDKTTGNLSAERVHTRSFIEFADGTKQYTANAGSGGGTVDSLARATANAAFDKANAANIIAQAAFDKANTDVTNISISSGVYGNSVTVPVISVAANGRIESITNTAIQVSSTVTVSETPPVSPQNNQMWWNSQTGKMYIYYSDGTSGQWVQDNSLLNDVNLDLDCGIANTTFYKTIIDFGEA